jgi:hypothetical protein
MRLIDGDALKRKMQKVATEAWKMKLTASIETTFNQCIDYIDSAPTITIEPKQGEWISMCGNKQCDCSMCGERFDHTYEWIERWNFCPNCGARMK